MENLEIFRNEFKNVNRSKICFKENGFTQFKPKNFYSELAGNLVKKLPKPPLKFNTDKTIKH